MVRFREILKRFHDHDVQFVVIGGVAGSLLGAMLGTLDVDVCAPLDDANLSKIIEALRGLNARWRFRPDKVFPVDSVEKFRGFKNLYIQTDLAAVDVLGELQDYCSFAELEGKTVDMDLGGFTCRVLNLETLIAVKRAVGRPKDLDHVKQLEAARRLREADADSSE